MARPTFTGRMWRRTSGSQPALPCMQTVKGQPPKLCKGRETEYANALLRAFCGRSRKYVPKVEQQALVRICRWNWGMKGHLLIGINE